MGPLNGFDLLIMIHNCQMPFKDLKRPPPQRGMRAVVTVSIVNLRSVRRSTRIPTDYETVFIFFALAK
jgi:hypothetical protein